MRSVLASRMGLSLLNLPALFLQLATHGHTENGSATKVWRYCSLLSRALAKLSKLPDNIREVSACWHGTTLVIAVFYQSKEQVPPFVVRSYKGKLAAKLYQLLSELGDPRIVLTMRIGPNP